MLRGPGAVAALAALACAGVVGVDAGERPLRGVVFLGVRAAAGRGPKTERPLRGPGVGRLGDDLLSHALRRSTIGAEGFHGRVRDGIGCWGPRHSHQAVQHRSLRDRQFFCAAPFGRGRMTWMLSDLRCAVLISSGLPAAAPLHWGAASGLPAACGGERFAGYRQVASDLDVSGWVKRSSSFERLVRLSFTHCCASTCRLSTWWSSTALERSLVLRGGSRLDAFSGYPVRT